MHQLQAPSSAATDCWVPARALRPVTPRCRCRALDLPAHQRHAAQAMALQFSLTLPEAARPAGTSTERHRRACPTFQDALSLQQSSGHERDGTWHCGGPSLSPFQPRASADQPAGLSRLVGVVGRKPCARLHRRRHAPAPVHPTLGFSCEGPTFTGASHAAQPTREYAPAPSALDSCKPLLGTCRRFAVGASSLPLTLRAGSESATPDDHAPVLVAVAGSSLARGPSSKHHERGCSASRASPQPAAHQPPRRPGLAPWRPFTFAVAGCSAGCGPAP